MESNRKYHFLGILGLLFLASCASTADRSVATEHKDPFCESRDFIDEDNFFEDYQYCQEIH